MKTSDEYRANIQEMGVDFTLLELEQNNLYARKEIKKNIQQKPIEKKPTKEKLQKDKMEKDEGSLEFTCKDVSTWKYNNNVCTLYKSDGSLLGTLHLDSLIKDYVRRNTKYKEPEQSISKMIDIMPHYLSINSLC